MLLISHKSDNKSICILNNYIILRNYIELLKVRLSSSVVFSAFAGYLLAINESIGERMINARLETIASKPSFKDSFIYKIWYI